MSSILVAGNPILDLVCTLPASEISKYNVEEGGYTEYDASKHHTIYTDLLKNKQTKLIPGGAGQNTARCAQKFFTDKPHTVVYLGAVGQDDYAAAMREAAERDGLRVLYESHQDTVTGTSACLVNALTKDRSMCTNLGGANHFTDSFLLETHWDLVEAANILFTAGFFVTASPKCMIALADYAASHDKKLWGTNLCAPFIIECFKDECLQWLERANFVVGNETEWDCIRKALGKQLCVPETATLEDTLRLTCQNAAWKTHPNKSRLFIATQGAGSTIVATKHGAGNEVSVQHYAVQPVPTELVCDTVGCGDGFISGLIVGLLKELPIEKCVELGNICGREVLQNEGAVCGDMTVYL